MSFITDHHPLDSTKAKDCHKYLITTGKCYSLTINISTSITCHSEKVVYQLSHATIKKILTGLNGNFQGGMVTMEYNKNKQQHFHIYFLSPVENEHTLIDQLKELFCRYPKILWNSCGNGWRLKKVDEVTPELTNYPFKDCKRTQQIADLAYDHFIPSHVVIRSKDNVMKKDHKPKKAPKRLKTIRAFLIEKAGRGDFNDKVPIKDLINNII
jgi:hypothetical protein